MCSRESEVNDETYESDVCDQSPGLCQRPGFVCLVSDAAFVHLWWGCSLLDPRANCCHLLSESVFNVTSILVPFAEVRSGAWN